MLVLDISTRPRKSKTHLATPLQTPVQGSDQTRLAPMKQRPGGNSTIMPWHPSPLPPPLSPQAHRYTSTHPDPEKWENRRKSELLRNLPERNSHPKKLIRGVGGKWHTINQPSWGGGRLAPHQKNFKATLSLHVWMISNVQPSFGVTHRREILSRPGQLDEPLFHTHTLVSFPKANGTYHETFHSISSTANFLPDMKKCTVLKRGVAVTPL